MYVLMKKSQTQNYPHYKLPSGYELYSADTSSAKEASHTPPYSCKSIIKDEFGNIVGEADLEVGKHFGDPRIMIKLIYVEEEYRGKGIGKLLMTWALDQCADKEGQDFTYIIVPEENIEGINLLFHFGFEPYRNHKPLEWPDTISEFYQNNEMAWKGILPKVKNILPQGGEAKMKWEFGQIGKASLMTYFWSGIFLLPWIIFTTIFFDFIPDIEGSAASLMGTVIVILASIFSLGIPFLSLGKKMGYTMKSLIPNFKIKWNLVVGGFIVAMGLNVFGGYLVELIEYLANAIGYTVLMESDMELRSFLSSNIALLSYVCILGPIVEEIVYRGIVLKVLKKYGVNFGIIMSATLFALFHGNIPQIVSTFFIGVVLAYLAIKTKSILIPIIIHMLNNTIIMLMDAVFINILNGEMIIIYIQLAFMIGAGLILLIWRQPEKLPEEYGFECVKSPSKIFLKTPIVIIVLAVTLFLILDSVSGLGGISFT